MTATFNVPPVQLVGNQTYAAASAWVGIDGDSCPGQALLQAGVDFINDNGAVSYFGERYAGLTRRAQLHWTNCSPSRRSAWYEWLPDVSHFWLANEFPIKEGDLVTVTVTADSLTSGRTILENTSTGVQVTKTLQSTYPLCLSDAEWIVEDFEPAEDDTPVDFANFGQVQFVNARATTNSGTTMGPDGASLIDMTPKYGQTSAKAQVEDSIIEVAYVPSRG